jgi:CO dehydrogenase/acetyl-CoA synthase epsilon subunit
VNKNAAQFHRFTVEEKNNIKADVLQGIISKGKNSILFIGYGLEGEDLKEKLLATFKSIDIQQ